MGRTFIKRDDSVCPSAHTALHRRQRIMMSSAGPKTLNSERTLCWWWLICDEFRAGKMACTMSNIAANQKHLQQKSLKKKNPQKLKSSWLKLIEACLGIECLDFQFRSVETTCDKHKPSIRHYYSCSNYIYRLLCIYYGKILKVLAEGKIFQILLHFKSLCY